MKDYSPEKILKALEEHYCESIFITDGEGNVVFVNDVGAQRLGSDVEFLLGKNVRDLTDQSLYSSSTTLAAINSKSEYIGPLNPGTKDSTISHSVPVLDSEGNVELVVTNNMSVEHSRDWESIIEKERAVTEKLRREIDNLRASSNSSITAQSKQMQRVLDRVDILAQAESNVVIIGESGTGKDLMARHIHEKSARSGEAFVSVNCAAIPENLLESELFGYEAGAFTGALAKGKIGLFEAATSGTLFLDEIGEMPLSLQSKLLRAIENREIRRVGGIKNIPIDVRIICATNANLEDLVEEKRFRDDLYYRLSVFTVKIPPLRERKDDILPLARGFLKELNTKYGTEKYFSRHAEETMLMHRWPGNIRELKNVVERIYVVSEGNSLVFTVEPYATAKDGETGSVGFLALEDYDSLKDYLAGAEKIYIENVLESCGGAMGKAAARLGIHRSQLYRKLKKMEDAGEKN